MDLDGATVGTVGERRVEPDDFAIDEHFWRVVGLYSAEGHCSRDTQRIHWALHPEREQHPVDEVVSFWQRHGIKVRTSRTATARIVTVSSRIVASWWRLVLGAPAGRATPADADLAWEQTLERNARAPPRAVGGRRLLVARQRRARA